MKLSDYTDADGGYTYNECYFNNATELLISGIIGFCGCGTPKATLKYIKNGLQYIRDRHDDKIEDYYPKVNEAEIFGSKDAAMFFYQWADSKDYTEHGGCVPGWLDEAGYDLLDMLKEWEQIEGEGL